MKITVCTDGASRGNPGEASYGFIIMDEKKQILYQEGRCIGIATNNAAEYSAVLEALKKIKSSFTKEISGITLYADSKLVTEQLAGRYKVKSKNLKPLIEQIKILAIELGGVIYKHVPRLQNAQADKLANLALDNKLI